MEAQDNYNVGIYGRLSKEDGNSSESTSIENQKQILTDYVEKKGWNLVDCYMDDGWSGTNFDRPEFKRMIADAERGRINCIITKDLSRLGRNHLEVGRYLEEHFRKHNIRYIALNDGVDTIEEEGDGNDFVAFRNIFNEWYPRDVSKKTRQAKRNGALQGNFMGSQAPYGFDKSPEDKHKLIIDEEAAEIVRRMFNDFANGDSARMIAEQFNQEHIDSPRFYRYAKTGRQNPLTGERNVWGSTTISQLLRNQVYIGNMVQGKRENVSFKSKQRRQVDPSKWIIKENTHEPIIERKVWDKVQERLGTNTRTRRTKSNTQGLFSGLIKCVDCGSRLAYNVKRQHGSEQGVYRCSRYNNNGKEACSAHYIQESYLVEFVLNDIRKYAQLASTEKEALSKRLMNSMNTKNINETGKLSSDIRKAEQRIDEIAQRLKSLYEDKCKGDMPDTVFTELMNGFTNERTELMEKVSHLRSELANIQDKSEAINDWLDVISEYADLQRLTRDIVYGLIDSITVSERKKLYERKVQEITIEYRFIKDLLQENKKDIA